MVVASQGVVHQFTTNHMACHLTPGRNGIPHTCEGVPCMDFEQYTKD